MGKTYGQDDSLELGTVTGPIPFDIDPAMFAWRDGDKWLDEIEQGYSTIVDNVIPHLEHEAAFRLRHEWNKVSRKNYPNLADGYTQWRNWWLKEVSRYSPTSDAADENSSLSAIGLAAINIFVVASRLRLAIEQKQAEKASALGMMLLAESLLGGYALRCTAAMETARALQDSRRAAFENGIGQSSDDLLKARLYTEAEAQRIWERDDSLRIGEVAKAVITGLRLSKAAFSEEFDIPDEPAVKKWIREAVKQGTLEMPAGAQAPGRPRKGT